MSKDIPYTLSVCFPLSVSNGIITWLFFCFFSFILYILEISWTLTIESKGREERGESKAGEGETLTFDELDLPGVSTVIVSVSFPPFNNSEV